MKVKCMDHLSMVLAIGLAGTALSSPALAEDSLKIGFAVSLTGFLAPYDSPTLDGAKIAIDDINAKGGAGGKHPIEAIIKDVRSDTTQTSVAVQELIDDGAAVIVVPCDDDPAIAGGVIAQAAGKPVFSTCATNSALPAMIGDYYFTNYVADNLQGATSAQFAHKQGYKTAYILVSPDTTYTNNLPQYFAETFEKLGGKLVGTGTYSMGQQDFSTEVTKIKALDPQPDVIMTSAYEPDFPAFLKQLRGAGVKAAVIGSDGIDSPTTLALGSVAEGIVYTNAGSPDAGTPLAQFFEKYEEVTGKPLTTAFPATGYEMIMMVNEAVRQADSLDGTAIRDGINSLFNFQGITGAITYAGRDRVPLRAIAINRVESGKAAHVETTSIDPSLVPEPR